MLIKSKIKRENGSNVTIEGTLYRFLPQPPKGDHVCEVENPKHAKRLLSVTEGFEPADDNAAAAAEVAAQVAPEPEPQPAPQPEPEPETQANPITAQTDAAAARLEENVEPAGNDETQTDETSPEQALENAVEPNDDGLDAMSDADLAYAFRDEFDKKPGNMKRDTIIKKIRENRAANTAG